MNFLLLSGAAMQRKESAGEGLAAMADGRMQWSVPEGNFWDDEKLQRRLPLASIAG